MMMKLKSKRFSRSFSRLRSASGKGTSDGDSTSAKETTPTRMDIAIGEVKWEMRPGGMLVQMREIGGANVAENVITVRVTNVSHWHDISIQPTSTFGELKKMLSKVTSLDVKEQRLLFKGKERDDGEHLHMVGVRDKDKVLLLQDPAIKEKKLLGLAAKPRPPIYRTISV